MKLKLRNLLYPLLLAGFISTLLSSCGIHLREVSAWPPELHTLYFEASDPNSPLSSQLQQTMQSFGVAFVATPEEAPIIFKLDRFLLRQSNPSINTTSLATTYTLSLSVTAMLMSSTGDFILPPKRFNVAHSILVSADQVLIPSIDISSSRELQRQAATLIYYWLTSNDVKTALENMHLHEGNSRIEIVTVKK